MYSVSPRLIIVQACKHRLLRHHVFRTGRPNWRRICHSSLHKLVLYFLAALCLAAKLRICALSLNSGRRSRWVHIFWWFRFGSYSSRRRDGSPIYTGIMASKPYTRLKGDSFVVDWGCSTELVTCLMSRPV